MSKNNADTVTLEDVPTSPYPALSGMFFKGKLPGQIRSVHADLTSKPAKLADFKKAISDGKISIDPEQLTTDLINKLTEMGIPVHEDVVNQVKARGRKTTATPAA